MSEPQAPVLPPLYTDATATPIAATLKRQLQTALAEIPANHQGVLLAGADTDAARVVVATRLGDGWELSAFANFRYRDKGRPLEGGVTVQYTW